MSFKPKFNVTLDTLTEPNKHWYCIDRPGYDKLPGVTTPLGIHDKPGLRVWERNTACDSILARAQERQVDGNLGLEELKRIVAEARRKPERERDQAATLGSLVHSLLDDFANGRAVNPDTIPVEALPAMSAFLEWWDSAGLEFVLGDTKVGSLVHHYGGSLDALAVRKSDGKLLLIDFKTSNYTYQTHALQAAGGYHIALQETYGCYAEEAWVLRFSKKLPVRFSAYQVASIERSRKAWVLTLELWREMQTSHFVAKRKPKENNT